MRTSPRTKDDTESRPRPRSSIRMLDEFGIDQDLEDSDSERGRQEAGQDHPLGVLSDPPHVRPFANRLRALGCGPGRSARIESVSRSVPCKTHSVRRARAPEARGPPRFADRSAMGGLLARRPRFRCWNDDRPASICRHSGQPPCVSGGPPGPSIRRSPAGPGRAGPGTARTRCRTLATGRRGRAGSACGPGRAG